MKIYTGIPGDKPAVMVTDTATGQSAQLAHPDGFGWGQDIRRRLNTARAILADLIGAAEAQPIYTRFMWRMVATWDKDKPFKIDERAILAVIRDIRDGQDDINRARAQAAIGPVPVENEGGPTVFGGGLSPITKKA